MIELAMAVGGSLVKVLTNSMASKQRAEELRYQREIAALPVQYEAFRGVRLEPISERMSITRQVLALSVVLSVVVLPKIAVIAGLFTGHEITIALQSEIDQGWVMGLFATRFAVELSETASIPISTFDTSMVSMILAMYFTPGGVSNR